MSRLLSDEYSGSAAAGYPREDDSPVEHHGEQPERRERCGPKSGDGFAFCRVQ